MKVALVVNPRAGRLRGAATGRQAARLMADDGWRVELIETKAPGEAGRLAREAAASGYELVVGVGGDGTLSELLNGLLGTGVPCGIIPCGTGNDFASFVGLSGNLGTAVRQLLDGSPRRIDMGRFVGSSRYFINSVGVGFDARIAERINRRRRVTSGLWAYLPTIFAELVRCAPLSATVEVDGQRYEDDWLLVVVANGYSYGAGFKIAPQARCDDGLLDVVLVGMRGRLAVLRALPRVRRGAHTSDPKVTMLRAQHVTIQTDQPSPALVDGDVRAQTPLEIEVAPGTALLWL